MESTKKLEKIISVLALSKQKIATAESCTGGLLASRITDISGASAVFDMGLVSYSNEIKHKYLGVPEDILNTFGAVSFQTAKAMAEGIVSVSGSDYGIGITGIAGPSGGTAEKPVGLVYFSVFCKTWDKPEVHKLNLSGSRAQVREQTCAEVVDRLYDIIITKP